MKTYHSTIPTDNMEEMMEIFRERLTNEATRDHALLGLTMIADNPTADEQSGPLIALENLSMFT